MSLFNSTVVEKVKFSRQHYSNLDIDIVFGISTNLTCKSAYRRVKNNQVICQGDKRNDFLCKYMCRFHSLSLEMQKFIIACV